MDLYPNILKIAKEWLEYPFIFVCYYENLVGEKGDGSSTKQEQEIISLAEYLNINISPEKIKFITNHLYGNSRTFRKGKISDWESCFTEEHKIEFKKRMGQDLIDLGYEKDFNW